MNVSRDSFVFAMEATKVIHEPDRRIATFGETRFEFQLLCESMDNPNEVRIRSGEIEAARPTIIRAIPEIEFEGFSSAAQEKLQRLCDIMRERGEDLRFLQYGFRFRHTSLKEETAHEPLAAIRDRLLEELRRSGNPLLAIIEGVDDAWEVSLLKFSMEMIMHSHRINTFDLKRNHLL